MAALSNPRWERFARAIVHGLGDAPYSQGRAYVAAGYSAKDAGETGGSAEACASRLLKKAKPILDRVRELQEQCALSTKVTVQSITAELEEARGIAKANDQASAMVAASSTKAKLHGLSIDKHEHGQPGAFSDATSTSELAEAMLREANPSLIAVNEEQRAMALVELARHAEAMAAIAQSAPALSH